MQRAGKSHKASGAEDGKAMQTYAFFKECRKVLEKYGHEDAAFEGLFHSFSGGWMHNAHFLS